MGKKYKNQALLDILDFIKQEENPIFVGHNIATFDLMILENRLKELNLYSFKASMNGFIDTLKLAKKWFPKIKLVTTNNRHL